MTTFIDFSWKVDEDRRRRAAALEQQRAQQAVNLNDSSSGATEQPVPTTCRTAAGEQPVLQRLGWRQRAKEFFRPGLRKKRSLKQFNLAQGIRTHGDEPIESPSLPGTGLQRLRNDGNQSTPILPLHSPYSDDDDFEFDDEEEITALPALPGHYNSLPAHHPRPPLQPVHDDTIYAASPWSSLESLTDRAMDEALAAADAPGNRFSSRPALPAEWLAGKPIHGPTPTPTPTPARTLRSVLSDGDLALRGRDRETGFLPLPSAVFERGSIPLPGLGGCDGDADGDLETSESGRLFGTGDGN